MTKEMFIKVRKLLGYTQSKFGTVLGVTGRHVRRLERGETAINLRLETYIRLLFPKQYKQSMEVVDGR